MTGSPGKFYPQLRPFAQSGSKRSGPAQSFESKPKARARFLALLGMTGGTFTMTAQIL